MRPLFSGESDLGLELIELGESNEVVHGQAMNLVTIAPRKVIMVGENPLTRDFFMQNEITVVAEPNLSELLKGAGGLGCATGILSRQITPVKTP